MPRKYASIELELLHNKINNATLEIIKAQKERTLAEERGRRWLIEICLIDDEIVRMLARITSDTKKGLAKQIHKEFQIRLLKIRDHIQMDSSLLGIQRRSLDSVPPDEGRLSECIRQIQQKNGKSTSPQAPTQNSAPRSQAR